jgi:thioredoxin 1
MAKSSFDNLIASETPILIDFYADWCGPCKTVAPILKELKEEMGDKVRIVKIDVDKNQEIAQKLQVRSIPTMMIYQKSEQKWRTQGVQTKALMKKKLTELISL